MGGSLEVIRGDQRCSRGAWVTRSDGHNKAKRQRLCMYLLVQGGSIIISTIII